MKKLYIGLFFLIVLVSGCTKNEKIKIVLDYQFEETLTISINKGDNISDKLTPMEYDKYAFDGWYDGDKQVSSDTIFIKDTVLVQYYSELHEVIVDGILYKVKNGDKLPTIPTPSKDGSLFLGWFVDETLYDLDLPVRNSFELNAKFEKIVITHNVYIDDQMYVIENLATVDVPVEPVKDDHIFLGWYIGDEKYDFTTKVTSDLNIVTKWERVDVDKVDVIAKDILDSIPSVVTSNLDLQTNVDNFTINYESSDTDIMTNGGKINKVIGQRLEATLKFSINYKTYTKNFEKSFIVERGYKSLDKMVAGYVYTNYDVTSKMLDNVDVIYCSFLSVDEKGIPIKESSYIGKVKQLLDRAHAKGVRVLICVGTSKLREVSLSSSARRTFSQEMVRMINEYGFDGIDIDFEIPQKDESEYYTLLMKELYTLVKANNSNHLVTTAIAGGKWQHTSYDLHNAKYYFDYLNMMLYSMHTTGKTTFQNSLYKSSKGYTLTSATVDESLEIFSIYNIDSKKIIIGVPCYGKMFKDTTGIGQSCNSIVSSTNYTTIVNYLESDKSYIKEYFDEETKSPYIVDELNKTLITYENKQSIAEKAKYIKDNNLGGFMYWQDGQDHENYISTELYLSKELM